MRSLIMSDIHGNLEALQSVINDAGENGGFDQIWQLGDVVGYGPEPGGCIDLLREYDHVGIAGNHDLAVAGTIGLDCSTPTQPRRRSGRLPSWPRSKSSTCVVCR